MEDRFGHPAWWQREVARIFSYTFDVQWTDERKLQEPESNSYVETTAMLIKKLKFFVQAVETIAQIPENHDQKKMYFNLMVG